MLTNNGVYCAGIAHLLGCGPHIIGPLNSGIEHDAATPTRDLPNGLPMRAKSIADRDQRQPLVNQPQHVGVGKPARFVPACRDPSRTAGVRATMALVVVPDGTVGTGFHPSHPQKEAASREADRQFGGKKRAPDNPQTPPG
jgi:hypothetical protein